MTTKTLVYTLIFVVTILNSCSPEKPYNDELISDEKEFNYLQSNDRGIRGDDSIVYYVDKDGTTLTAYKGDVAKWHVSIEEACKVPTDVKVEVLYMALMKDELYVIFGERTGKQNSAKINIRDGKARYRCAESK